ncbi:hypothetical protein HWV62_24610 [Athelia sp. TMB]|nr:hypothetical protein HWV62_24610 [Athelia sp. TMB]
MDVAPEPEEIVTLAVFDTQNISGGTVNNVYGDYIDNQIHGDYIAHAQIHFNFAIQSAPEREEILDHIRAAYSMPSLGVAQSTSTAGPQPNASHIAATPFYIDTCYISAARSIIETRLMIDMVRMMINNPKLCSSAGLPETLAALERVLLLTELSVRAYHHTPLSESLSRGIAIEVDECRRLLQHLLSNLSSYRHMLSAAVIYFIRKYIWRRFRRGGAVATLDLELRRSHRSFAACLLALGRAAWPELERGTDALAQLAELYSSLESELASLRHLEVDTVTVVNHLGRNMPVPLIFCKSWPNFHIVISGFCKGSAGSAIIQRGDYRILKPNDDVVISRSDISTELRPGMTVEMSIMLHEQAKDNSVPQWSRCPRCKYDSVLESIDVPDNPPSPVDEPPARDRQSSPPPSSSSSTAPNPTTVPRPRARSPALGPRPRAIYSPSQILQDEHNLTTQGEDTPSQRSSDAYTAAQLESTAEEQGSPIIASPVYSHSPPSAILDDGVSDIPFQGSSRASIVPPLESIDRAGDSPSAASQSDLSSISSMNDNESPSSSAPTPMALPTMTKRTHALIELLSSERAHASDLALIQQIHIPLALGAARFHSAFDTLFITVRHTGQSDALHLSAMTPPSPTSSTRTRSTDSESSATSATSGPPMTLEDTRIIFGNITELAMFSDTLVERLEEALGAVLDGGTGDDRVGALFLSLIPTMEPLYKTYITRHPTALAHLSNLPVTPALTAYLARSKTLASSLTHAWDLPSLLIKPVQRLLNYPLYLSAIIAETADAHPDKENLKLARTKMEDAARGVNEHRRRWEVVKKVLGTKPGEKGRKVPVVVQATTRIRNIRSQKDRAASIQDAEQLVELMERELKRSEESIKQLAKDAIAWGHAAKATIISLRQWTAGFGQIIGLSPEQTSEAFDAFIAVIEQQLIPLGDDLHSDIQDKFLPSLALLVESMKAPLRSLEAMHTMEPLHHALLNHNPAKGRPPPQMLEASQSYMALRGQLHAELPRYLKLLDKGIAASIIQLAERQTAYWADVRERWGDLWEALRVEGESNAGSEETVQVWWLRFEEVAAYVHRLDIVNPKKTHANRPPRRPEPEPTTDNPNPGIFLARPVDGAPPSSPASDRFEPSQLSPIAEIDEEPDPTPVSERTAIRPLGEGTTPPSPGTAATHSGRPTPGPAPRHTATPAPSSTSEPVRARALYACLVVHPCSPPAGTQYRDLPFFALRVNAIFDVLREFGHPALHPDLPLHVDGGDDCLLLVRDNVGRVGWALASFFVPVD